MTDDSMTARVSDLIAAEREALLNGDFDRIADLLDEKNRLIEGFATQEPDPEDLADLRSGLRRNHELFDHALAGLRGVVARLGAIESHAKSLETYTAEGQRMTIDAQPCSVERRA